MGKENLETLHFFAYKEIEQELVLILSARVCQQSRRICDKRGISRGL